MALLNDTEKQRVAATITRVEQGTAGELVVVVASRCDDYAYFRAVAALATTIGVAWGCYLLIPTLHSAWVFAGQVVGWLVSFAAYGANPILRLLVPAGVQAAAVDARTKQLFIERGLTETRDRSAVLIVVSECEHRVQILADRGIHERVTVAHWNTEVQGIIAAVRSGHAADGLCTAIESIGAKLHEHFPARDDNPDELSNAVVEIARA